MSAESGTVHEHHWEVSWAPLLIAIGVMLLVPLTFAAFFVYEAQLYGIIFAGLGTPLIVAGIVKWIREGVTEPAVISGVSDVGIGIFIISEILIFLSLFAGYWMMRISSGAAGELWPPAGTPEINKILPLIMTVILVASSITYHKGEEEYHEGNIGSFKKWVFITILLGLTFFGCTMYEYNHLIHAGFNPGTNAYSTAFYSLTGFHASHVLIGIISFLFLLMFGTVNKMFVKVAGIYWHFVDIVWFFVATQIYYW
ncbi:MAG: heme-copper oxidase subunit III [bacterium]|nr:heme-copper oxidase subunit III [bacterium]